MANFQDQISSRGVGLRGLIEDYEKHFLAFQLFI